MADDTIGITEPASPNKKLQSYLNTVSGNSVEAEATVQVDLTGVPVPRGTNGDPIFIAGQASLTNWVGVKLTSDATNPASVINTAPTTQYGLVTRNIPSGTQTVSISGTPTVTANQGTPAAVANAWPIKVTDGTNTASVQPDTSLLATGKVGPVPMGVDVSTGFFSPIPLIAGQTTETVAVSIQGAGIGLLIGKESGSGSLSSVGSVVIINTINGFSGAVGVTGAFTGTIIFEASDPTTFNWFQIPAKRVGRGDWVNGITGSDSPGFFTFPRIPGASQIRARAIAFSSATAATFNTYADGSPQTNRPESGPAGFPITPELHALGARDPQGNLQPLTLDSLGNLAVIQTPSFSDSVQSWSPVNMWSNTPWSY